MAGDGDTAAPATAGSAGDLELKIVSALRFREGYLKEQADSLNMLKVRRLLEKDLGVENFALDEHKKFIKQHVCEILGVTGDGVANGLKTEMDGNDASIMKGITGDGVANGLNTETDGNDASIMKGITADSVNGDLLKDNTTDDSPVLDYSSENEKTKQGTKESQGNEDIDINEGVVRTALQKRADYFRANLDNLTLAGVRRLLEDDLKLERYSLDPFKKFVSGELDEIITPPPVSASKLDKKKSAKNIVSKKASKTVSNEGTKSSDSKTMESSEEEGASSRKRIASKARADKKQTLEKPKKRKLATNETKGSRKKSKPQEKLNSAAEVDQNSSENDESPSQVAKNKASTPVYGKRVEQLKSVIKSCGLRIPPVIYKRAKQAPENKHESVLIKELEDILSKEGLSANPSEKEIKDVKRRKDRERELEGIDMSNIVSSSRRRATTRFVAPVKPVVPVESDGSQSDDDDDDGDDSDSDENDDLKDEVDENDDLKDELDDNDDETKNGSQSEGNE